MGNSLIITTGGGTDTSEGNPNVVEGVILTGYSAYNVEGERLSGSMPYQTTSSSNVNVDTAITIPAGYHDGTHSVSSVSLSSKTSATADAGHVLNAYKGWKSGSLITGTMANKGTTNGSISANGTYTVPVGWHNGSGKVTQSLTTKGWAAVTPSTGQQTVVASSRWVTGDQIVVGNGNLAAGNIKSGVTIFGVTGNYSQAAISGLYHNGTLYHGCHMGHVFHRDNRGAGQNSRGKLIPDPNSSSSQPGECVIILQVNFINVEQILRSYGKVRIIGYHQNNDYWNTFGIGAVCYTYAPEYGSSVRWSDVLYQDGLTNGTYNFFFVNINDHATNGYYDMTINLPDNRIEQCDRLRRIRDKDLQYGQELQLQFCFGSWSRTAGSRSYTMDGFVEAGAWLSTWAFVN